MIAALGVVSPEIAHAQMDRGVGVTIEFAPRTPLQGDLDLDPQTELGYRNIRANVIVPVELESWCAVLLPGAAYRLYRPRVVDSRFDSSGPETLHDLNLRLGLLKEFGDTWSLLVSAAAGIATDYEDVEADHLRYQGGGVIRYDTGGSWIFGAGVAFTYWFGEPRVLPIAQITYAGVRWNADLTFPRIATLQYTILEGFELGLSSQVDGNRFSIGGDLPFESVDLSIADAGLSASVRIMGSVWLTALGGMTVFRRLEYLDEENNELFNLDQKQGPIFRVGIVLRPDND